MKPGMICGKTCGINKSFTRIIAIPIKYWFTKFFLDKLNTELEVLNTELEVLNTELEVLNTELEVLNYCYDDLL